MSPGLLSSRVLVTPSAVLIVDDESAHAAIIEWVIAELAPEKKSPPAATGVLFTVPSHCPAAVGPTAVPLADALHDCPLNHPHMPSPAPTCSYLLLPTPTSPYLLLPTPT